MKEEQSGKAKGGLARAKSLSADERKKIAQKAAKARWSQNRTNLPKATHKGVLKIVDIEIPCFVLDDGRRVISGRGLTSAIGMKGRGQGISRIADHRMIEANKNNNIAVAINNPIKFIGGSPKINTPSDGFEAVVLQELCEAILQARDSGDLKTEQEKRYGKYADTLIRSFAKVGIIALVDEATGYQQDRARDALAKILEAYVAKELQPWVKTFPSSFYEQMFRLRGLKYPDKTVKRPQYFGHLTNDIIYRRLAPGVLEELKTKAVKDEKNRLKHRLHQNLTQETGHPKLRDLVTSVTTIMKLSDKWNDFREKLDKVHMPYGETMKLPFGIKDEEEGI